MLISFYGAIIPDCSVFFCDIVTFGVSFLFRMQCPAHTKKAKMRPKAAPSSKPLCIFQHSFTQYPIDHDCQPSIKVFFR